MKRPNDTFTFFAILVWVVVAIFLLASPWLLGNR